MANGCLSLPIIYSCVFVHIRGKQPLFIIDWFMIVIIAPSIWDCKKERILKFIFLRLHRETSLLPVREPAVQDRQAGESALI